MTHDEYEVREQCILESMTTAKNALMSCEDIRADFWADAYLKAAKALYAWHDMYDQLVNTKVTAIEVVV